MGGGGGGGGGGRGGGGGDLVIMYIERESKGNCDDYIRRQGRGGQRMIQQQSMNSTR